MRNLPNIEKSGFHRGEYVGYAAGIVWRIRKTNSSYGNWIARPNAIQFPKAHLINDVYAMRLEDMSAKLSTWKLPEGI